MIRKILFLASLPMIAAPFVSTGASPASAAQQLSGTHLSSSNNQPVLVADYYRDRNENGNRNPDYRSWYNNNYRSYNDGYTYDWYRNRYHGNRDQYYSWFYNRYNGNRNVGNRNPDYRSWYNNNYRSYNDGYTYDWYRNRYHGDRDQYYSWFYNHYNR